MTFNVLAEGLQFPEGPIAMADGSVILVEIARGTLSRVWNGKIEVICDLGGWVASAYMRGIPYVNLPTTLLAQVDGAVGGKVAVNHPRAKNLLGAFHQPLAVIAGIEFLRSTGEREFRSGLAEVIKKALIASPECWAFIEASADELLERDRDALLDLVRAATAIKTELVERDPRALRVAVERGCGDLERAMRRRQRERDLGIHPGEELLVGVGHAHLGNHRACRLVERSRRPRDSPRELLSGELAHLLALRIPQYS